MKWVCLNIVGIKLGSNARKSERKIVGKYWQLSSLQLSHFLTVSNRMPFGAKLPFSFSIISSATPPPIVWNLKKELIDYVIKQKKKSTENEKFKINFLHRCHKLFLSIFVERTKKFLEL